MEFQLAQTEEARLKAAFIDISLWEDMDDYGWIKLGEAEVSIKWTTSREELMQAAVKHLDEAEEGLRINHKQKLAALEEVRGKLLALPNKP